MGAAIFPENSKYGGGPRKHGDGGGETEMAAVLWREGGREVWTLHRPQRAGSPLVCAAQGVFEVCEGLNVSGACFRSWWSCHCCGGAAGEEAMRPGLRSHTPPGLNG